MAPSCLHTVNGQGVLDPRKETKNCNLGCEILKARKPENTAEEMERMKWDNLRMRNMRWKEAGKI